MDVKNLTWPQKQGWSPFCYGGSALSPNCPEGDWARWLERRLHETLPDLRVERGAFMSRYTSLRIGGPAGLVVFPRCEDELRKVIGLCAVCNRRPFISGKGTDLLVADEGLPTVVIRTTEMHLVWQTGEEELQAQAGVSLAALATLAWKLGLSGLEFAHGIPGTLGGALVMNAGAYDGEMKQVVQSVDVLRLSEKNWPRETVPAADCRFAYRSSAFGGGEQVIVSARLRLKKDDPRQIRSRMDALQARRKASQPLEYPSAGSVFKRPEGYYAGTLIQQSGLKGLQIGGAQVSEKHAGFIINRGDASCADVLALVEKIRTTVQEQQGVWLEPEIKFIG